MEFKILGLLCYSNAGIGIPECPNEWSDEDYTKWNDYIRAVVERYDGDTVFGPGTPTNPTGITANPITHWEVWNEPNLDYFWHGESYTLIENVDGFVKLLSTSCYTIKNCYDSPDDGKVVSGGINGFPWVYSKGTKDYIDYFFERGGSQYFDIFGIHPYRNRGPYEYSDTYFFIGSLKDDLERLKNKYVGSKPIWITEIGWDTPPGVGHPASDEYEQAEWLMDTYNIASSLGFVDNVFWYAFRDYPAFLDYFGIVKNDYSEKQSYYGYQYLTGIRTASPVARVMTLDKTSLDFGEVRIGRSKTLSFTITNTCNGTIIGTISCDRDWISVTPRYFKSNNQTVKVTVDTSDKSEGQYTGTVSITSNSGDRNIPVTVAATCVFTRPNPYNPRTGKLTFFGSGVQYSTIKIYTLAGELVKTLKETTGSETKEWDGKNEAGKEVISGIYLYTTENSSEKNACSFTVVKK